MYNSIFSVVFEILTDKEYFHIKKMLFSCYCCATLTKLLFNYNFLRMVSTYKELNMLKSLIQLIKCVDE